MTMDDSDCVILQRLINVMFMIMMCLYCFYNIYYFGPVMLMGMTSYVYSNIR